MVNDNFQTHFISFAAGQTKYFECMKNLCNTAANTGVFNKVVGYSDAYLRTRHEFWDNHGNFVEKCVSTGKRGFGYWLWKPFLLIDHMKTMSDGDVLIYMDGGCLLNVHGLPRLKEYIQMVKEHPSGCIGFKHNNEWNRDNPVKGLPERDWTKRDVTKFFNLTDDCEIMTSPQLIGGILVLRVCDKVREMVGRWYKVCGQYNLLADEPSVSLPITSFIEHRHDQSIWSIIRKQENCLLLDNEVYFGPTWNTPKAQSCPFWAYQMPHRMR